MSRSPERPTQVTILGCGAVAVTIGIAADSVTRVLPLTQVESLGVIDSAQWDGCPVEDVAFDARRNVAFLVLPDKARDDLANPKRYRIVATQLPTFARIATFETPGGARASLLFDSIGDRLLAQIFTSDTAAGPAPLPWEEVLLSLSSPDLSVRHRSSQHIPNRIDGSFVIPLIHSADLAAERTHVSPDGRRLVNRSQVIEWVGDTLVARRHASRMSPSERLRAASHLGSDSLKYVALPADAGAERVLFGLTVPARDRPTMLAFLREVQPNGADHPMMEVARGRLTLLADGRRIVMQETDGPLDRPASSVRVTGRVQLFDGMTGRKEAEFNDPRLAGSFGMVVPMCSTADGSRLYLRAANAALAVIRMATSDVVLLEHAGPVDPSSACLFFPQRDGR